MIGLGDDKCNLSFQIAHFYKNFLLTQTRNWCIKIENRIFILFYTV